ncbi:MAG: hypothetical protein JXR51_08725 [Bacteroidales bacterium]|nr:hypothetical protein [Bacteroidales bacterium]MBN2757247.1 hypothetical protein [Bacteroidales bacterium]
MKKKVYLVIVVLSLVAFMSSCRGFKNAPPCPAYSMTEMPANQSVAN